MKENNLNDLKIKLEEKNVNNIDELMKKYEKWYDLGLESGLNEDEIMNRLNNDADIQEGKPNYSFKNFANNVKEHFESKDVTGYNVTINLVDEDVEITYGDDPCALVSFEDVNPNDYQVTSDTSNLIVERKSSAFKIFRKKTGGKVFVTLPRISINILSIDTVSGDLSVDDIEANEVVLNTVNGDYDIDSLKGSTVTINTVSGDFTINEIYATEAVLECVNGDIKIKFLKTGNVEFSAVNGDVEVERLEANSASGNTVNGDILINSSNVEVDATSINGDVTVNDVKADNVSAKVSREVNDALSGLKDMFKKKK